MNEHQPDLRLNVERRLGFIEFRLFWDGRVNRVDIIEQFGISVPQASADLKRYQELAPENLRYDQRLKTYVATSSFSPLILRPSADRYLAQLRTVAAGILKVEDTWLGEIPPYATVPLLRRPVAPDLLKDIVQAVKRNIAMHILYQSVTHDSPQWRWIAPQALGFDGYRWHARAWCFERLDFRDFVLARIHGTSETRPADVRTADDVAWHRRVTLKLAANPELSENARKAVEQEYGMANGFVDIETSVSLSYYVEKQMNLDLAPGTLAPHRQQLILLNRDEVAAIRSQVLKLTQREY